MTTCHFRAQNSPFAQNENFFRKTINICSMYLSAPFIVQNFKKILRIDPKLWGRTIFRVKMARLLQKIFFSDNPCCVQSCLSACKKKKIESDVSPLTRYWRLKNTENADWPRAFLAITWEPNFSQICDFGRMLKGHKYFHSTSFPDKTNE